MTEEEGMPCPVCGVGTLADISYDGGPRQERSPEQQPTSRQLMSYTCGHTAIGARLETADERLDVERRTSDDAAEPLPDGT
jgi:hypothetical protein